MHYERGIYVENVKIKTSKTLIYVKIQNLLSKREETKYKKGNATD